MLYTTTAQGCGGTPNQFYGYDLATKKVGSFNPGSGGLWPRLGPSIGKDGSVYAGSGDGDYYPERQIFGQAIIAVKQNPQTKALEMTDWYAPSNAYWLRKRDLDMNATGPVFEFKGKEYTVHTSKECRVWLLDTSSLGGEDHRTPVYRTPLICNEEVQFAGGRRVGRARDVGGVERHALDPRALLGPEALGIHRADRARAGRAGSGRRLQAGREGWQAAAHAGLALAQHVAGRSGRDRQRCRLRVRERRGRDAGDVRRRACRTTRRRIGSRVRGTRRSTRSTR